MTDWLIEAEQVGTESMATAPKCGHSTVSTARRCGGLVAVMGPSRSGKSTLLNVLRYALTVRPPAGS
jgi:ABC-type lipoprotein export system ATPase subunit